MDKFGFNHFRRFVIYVILGLPLLLFSLIFPVKVRCSSCPFLNTSPKNSHCDDVILLKNVKFSNVEITGNQNNATTIYVTGLDHVINDDVTF